MYGGQKMKGMITALSGTIVVALVAVAVLAMGFLALVAMQFTGAGSGYIEFVSASGRPYAIGSLLSELKVDDRMFLEHAVEIAVSNVTNASSQRASGYLKDFFTAYRDDKPFISVSIARDNEELFYMANSDMQCGDNLEGYCVDSAATQASVNIRGYQTHNCGAGRRELDKSLYNKNKCDAGLCCVEDLTDGHYSPYLATCGPERGEKKGICDISLYGKCTAGRVNYPSESGECLNGNVCCIPIAQADETAFPRFSTIRVPLFYRDGFLGTMEVSAI
jgi:hypothetical protein